MDDTKLDKIAEDIGEIKVTLASQAVTLQDHTRRSLAAEENVSMLRQEFAPIKDHVAFMQGVGKTLTVLIALIAAVAGILKLLH